MEEKASPVVHSFSGSQSKVSSLAMKNVVIVFVIIAILGVGTGFVLASITKTTGKSLLPLARMGTAQKGQTFGSGDIKIFKDVAEGKLENGGVNGEGQYHLVRPGGDSQNVYMTSSIVDLSQFIGQNIKVWGETQKAQTAGWLMDVGKVEIL